MIPNDETPQESTYGVFNHEALNEKNSAGGSNQHSENPFMDPDCCGSMCLASVTASSGLKADLNYRHLAQGSACCAWHIILLYPIVIVCTVNGILNLVKVTLYSIN